MKITCKDCKHLRCLGRINKRVSNMLGLTYSLFPTYYCRYYKQYLNRRLFGGDLKRLAVCVKENGGIK